MLTDDFANQDLSNPNTAAALYDSYKTRTVALRSLMQHLHVLHESSNDLKHANLHLKQQLALLSAELEEAKLEQQQQRQHRPSVSRRSSNMSADSDSGWGGSDSGDQQSPRQPGARAGEVERLREERDAMRLQIANLEKAITESMVLLGMA